MAGWGRGARRPLPPPPGGTCERGYARGRRVGRPTPGRGGGGGSRPVASDLPDTPGRGPTPATRPSAGATGAVPVADPDSVEAGGLIDVEDQLGKLFQNTEALLSGLPAHDVLLYGPRGSGKSTAVRSLLSRYGEQGLRLIEVERDDLGELQRILRTVAGQPLKFVIFVDDLSFDRGGGGLSGAAQPVGGGVSRAARTTLGSMPPATADTSSARASRIGPTRSTTTCMPGTLTMRTWPWPTASASPSPSRVRPSRPTCASSRGSPFARVSRSPTFRCGPSATPLGANGYSGRTARQFIDSLRAGLPVAAP